MFITFWRLDRTKKGKFADSMCAFDAIFILKDEILFGNVDFHNLILFITIAHNRAFRRENIMLNLIEIFLECQAAHEPSAKTAYFGRTQAQILVARHLAGDRLELIKEGFAAEGPPADSNPAEPPGFVTNTDLTKFYAGTVFCGKILDKCTKIYALVRGKKETDLVAVELVFNINQFHLEIVFKDFFLADDKCLFLFVRLSIMISMSV